MRSAGIAALAGVVAFGLFGASGGATPSSVADPDVAAAVARDGSAKVMIVFRAPQAGTLGSTVSVVRAVRSRVLSRAGDGFRPTALWDAVSAVPGWITARGLERLASDPDVVRIGLDGGAGRAADNESTPLIRADQAHARGFTGVGVTVGILDSGIDEGHPDLQAAIVGEHCVYDCPGGPDRAQDRNGHGTNVAGIVASRGTIAPLGIAPGANLVMVKMLDQAGVFPSSDQIVDSLNWIALNRPDVKVINMSIDTFMRFPGYCDGSAAWTMAIASAVATLHSAGVTLFASSGNDKATTSMPAPACIKDVVSVGAVYDSAYGSNQIFCRDPSAADRVTCFSDSSPALDILAPGALITSTGLRSQGSPVSIYIGTSQASPHAAGTAALLLQARPTLTPDQIEAVLKASGKPITDWRVARLTPRIDALAALDVPIVPHTLTVSRAGSTSGSVTSNPAGIDCGSTCSHTYDFGASVTLTAARPKGFTLRWSGDCLGSGSCTVSMGADHSVTANFIRIRCVVPNVKGKTLAAARSAILKGHCKVGKITRAVSRVKKGRVISQAPKARRALPAGTRVSLKISRGPKR